VIGTYAAWLARNRNVISWEAVTQPYLKKHMMAYKLASRWFAVSVAVSNAIRDQVRNERGVSEDKTQTIHYGVDLETYFPGKQDTIRRLLKLKSDTCIISTVARLTEQKGHCYLLPAIPEVVRMHPQAHFVFIGDGPLRPLLEKQCLDLGIRNHVHFLGFRQDVVELLQSTDLFVLPSLYEGLPNVVLEAMACGLPVIATAVDGTPEAVVDGETGILVPSKDPEKLKQALLALIPDNNKRRTMGKNARHCVETDFSFDRQLSEFVALYEKLSP
jgi:glycosyltransferase involved in cell wall biosynthesis